MRRDIKKRLDEIESVTTDWVADLDIVDYVGLTDYSDGDWEELHFDETITVLRHKVTGEIRGVYNDRRTDDQYPPFADFAYL